MTSAAAPVRVVIVDDHPVVRNGLRGMLEGDDGLDVVGEAADEGEALRVVARVATDVVLMDLRMPEIDGVIAIARLAFEHPDVRVLVLTTYDGEVDILRAVEAGASGYLLKDTPKGELRRAIRATAAGETVLAPAVAARLVVQARRPPTEALTAREVEVLELVARGGHQPRRRPGPARQQGHGEVPPPPRLRQTRRRRPQGSGDHGAAAGPHRVVADVALHPKTARRAQGVRSWPGPTSSRWRSKCALD